MTETIDTANLRALAENIIAADGPIWWIEQDFRAVKEVLDATIDDARFVAAANPTAILALLDRLAAAEARNATLTDDAARYRFLRDMTAAPSWYASHANMGISCEVFDMRLDAEIARAAASISTKGDGP